VPYATVSEAAARQAITAVSASKAWNLAGLKCAQLVFTRDEDLGHICERSAVGAEVAIASLPSSAALRAAFGAECAVLQAGGGDDYELCFTAPRALRETVALALEQVGIEATRVGRIVAGSSVRALDADGAPWQPPRAGYVHFG
jgi:thiamine-monophosphate kinase